MNEGDQPMNRTREGYLHNDQLMIWLNAKKAEASKKPVIRILGDAVTQLDSLAGRLSAFETDKCTLSDLPEAVELIGSLEVILPLYARDARRLQPVSWLADLWEKTESHRPKDDYLLRGMRHWTDPVSLDGTINDILQRAYGIAEQEVIILTSPQELEADFKKPFLGVGATALDKDVLQKLRKVQGDEKPYYACVIPVLQSSGSGKTRTVMQLSQSRLGMLVCVRPKSGPLDAPTSIPPRDDDVADLLLAPTGNIFEETRILATWLIALARTILRFYQEYAKSHPIDPLASGEERNEKDWSDWKKAVGELLKPPSASTSPVSSPTRQPSAVDPFTRKQLLKDVSELARELMSDARYNDKAYRKYRKGAVVASKATESTEAARFFQTDLAQAFTELVTFAKSSEGSDEYFHLAIDECGALGERLYTLRRLWSYTKGVVLFWLDTNTRIGLTYDDGLLARSARPGSVDSKLMEPFLALPQNLALRADIERYNKLLTSREVLTTHQDLLSWLPKMGRPMLNDTPYQKVSTNTVKILSAKLLRDWRPDPWDSCQQTMAVAAQRITFTLSGLQGKLPPTSSSELDVVSEMQFAMNLVNNHLRRLSKVMPGGDRVKTSSPSEPLLSLAAADLFRAKPKDAWMAALKYIEKSRAEYGLVPGDHGEEVARICLSSATDFASLRGAGKDERLRAFHPINLADWLEEMFFATWAERHTAEAEALLEDAKAYWINFTHYMRSSCYFRRTSKMPNAALAEAYTRQAAIVGLPLQPGWDVVIPIYKSTDGMPIGEKPFDPVNLSYIPVQVKNVVGGDSSLARTNFGSSSIDRPAPAQHPFIITIWFDLQGEPSPCVIQPMPPLEVQPQPVETVKKAGERNYHLKACGHGSETLKVLGKLVDSDSDKPIRDTARIVRELLGVDRSLSVDPVMLMKENDGETCWSYQ